MPLSVTEPLGLKFRYGACPVAMTIRPKASADYFFVDPFAQKKKTEVPLGRE